MVIFSQTASVVLMNRERERWEIHVSMTHRQEVWHRIVFDLLTYCRSFVPPERQRETLDWLHWQYYLLKYKWWLCSSTWLQQEWCRGVADRVLNSSIVLTYVIIQLMEHFPLLMSCYYVANVMVLHELVNECFRYSGLKCYMNIILTCLN